jgi:hypothetical protein
MRLKNFILYVSHQSEAISLQSFVGSNISQSLELLCVMAHNSEAIDDIQVATALASCHNLNSLFLEWGRGDGCQFGRNGLDGLLAMATGCPLLTEIHLPLTVPGLQCLGKHFPKLKKCHELSRRGGPFQLSVPDSGVQAEFRALYPSIAWN